MKLLDRYMSAVAHCLPENRREEITRELRANILDRLEHLAEQSGNEPSEAQVANVLTEMGHPQKVALQFLPPQRLVSEELFPLYKQALGYALIIIFLVEVIKFSVMFLSGAHIPPLNATSGFIIGLVFKLLFGILNQGLLGFAILTGVFYVLSNPPGGAPLFKLHACWRPEQLPPVVHDWQRIKACEQASEISMSVFMLLVLFYQLWMPLETLQAIVVVFSADLSPWLNVLSAVVIASLIFSLWNLRYGFWTVPKLGFNALLNTACAFIFLWMSRMPEIFVFASHANPDDLTGLVSGLNESFKIGFLITGLWFLYEIYRDVHRAWLLKKS